METWTVAQGFAMPTRTITVKDGQGTPVTGYTGTETLAGVVWAGDDRAPLVSFTPTWNTPPALVNVALSTAQTAALGPGLYTLEVYPADRSAEFYRGLLEVTASAGSGAPEFCYITYNQLLRYAAQVGRLQDDLADEAQFAKQRAAAGQDFDRWVLARYQPQPGRARRYLSADGTAPGPYPVFSRGPGGADAPPRATIAGYLGTSAVVANEDLVETVAHQALSIIYLGQPGRDNVYRETGMSERALARECFGRCLVEIDTNNDGVAEIRIDQDVTWLT